MASQPLPAEFSASSAMQEDQTTPTRKGRDLPTSSRAPNADPVAPSQPPVDVQEGDELSFISLLQNEAAPASELQYWQALRWGLHLLRAVQAFRFSTQASVPQFLDTFDGEAEKIGCFLSLSKSPVLEELEGVSNTVANLFAAMEEAHEQTSTHLKSLFQGQKQLTAEALKNHNSVKALLANLPSSSSAPDQALNAQVKGISSSIQTLSSKFAQYASSGAPKRTATDANLSNPDPKKSKPSPTLPSSSEIEVPTPKLPSSPPQKSPTYSSSTKSSKRPSGRLSWLKTLRRSSSVSALPPRLGRPPTSRAS
jgi:hypothetical protein